MQLIGVEAKDITVIIEETLTGLEMIKLALDLSKIEYNGDNEKERESVIYLTKTIYPFIIDTIEKVKGKDNDY